MKALALFLATALIGSSSFAQVSKTLEYNVEITCEDKGVPQSGNFSGVLNLEINEVTNSLNSNVYYQGSANEFVDDFSPNFSVRVYIDRPGLINPTNYNRLRFEVNVYAMNSSYTTSGFLQTDPLDFIALDVFDYPFLMKIEEPEIYNLGAHLMDKCSVIATLQPLLTLAPPKALSLAALSSH